MYERVQKIIAHAGITSRRKAEELIIQGRVQVNGTTIHLGDKADAQQDRITVNGTQLILENKKYYVLNKPTGYITAASDHRGRNVVTELIHTQERVYPAGRLDLDTTGLLILTNDGDFANKLMHPRYEKTKTYKATLDKPAPDKLIMQLRTGVTVDDRRVHITSAERNAKNIITITIHEGRKHIVKKIFKTLGYEVIQLTRIAIGKLDLGNLKEGQYRELTDKEKLLLLH